MKRRPASSLSLSAFLACVVAGLWACLWFAPPAQSQASAPVSDNKIAIKTAPKDLPSTGTAFIEGIVYDARTKKPIPKAEIWTEGFETDSAEETITDDAGRYRFAVEPGNYFLSAVGEHHSRRRFESFQVPRKGLRLNIGLVKKAVVKGSVRDSSGRPIAKVRIAIYDPNTSLELIGDQVETDQNGNFFSDALDVHLVSGEARYGIQFSHPKYSISEKEIVARAHYYSTDELVVNTVLQSRAIVKGRITNKGKPVEYGFIYASDTDQSAQTNGNGRYVLSLSAPKDYLLTLVSDDTLPAQVKVQLKPGQTIIINRDLKPFPYGSIAGRVLDLKGKPIAGATIELWTPNTSETGTAATTDKNGRYRVRKVVPRDDYRVVAHLPRAQTSAGPDKSPVRVKAYETTLVNLRGDVTAPSARMLSPASGSTVKGFTIFKVKTADNYALDSADLMLDPLNDEKDGVSISTVQGYREKPVKEKLVRAKTVLLKWNTRDTPNGWHRLRITVYDLHGNAVTIPLRVRVKNP